MSDWVELALDLGEVRYKMSINSKYISIVEKLI